MPQVTGGLVEPRYICVSLVGRLRNVKLVLGTVTNVDPRAKLVSWADPEGEPGQISYDRLILTAGSVNKLLPIPGVADYAHGFRTVAEAIYLREPAPSPARTTSARRWAGRRCRAAVGHDRVAEQFAQRDASAAR